MVKYIWNKYLFKIVKNLMNFILNNMCNYSKIFIKYSYKKLINIIYKNYNKNIKIIDLRLSNTYRDSELLKTACGSPCYAAPEMIAGRKYIGTNVDIWSCGVILFAMVCGYLPFEDPNTGQLYKKILSANYQIPSFVSNECRDLMK